MPQCTYPLTGLALRAAASTPTYAVFDITPEGPRINRTFGIPAAELADRLALRGLAG